MGQFDYRTVQGTAGPVRDFSQVDLVDGAIEDDHGFLAVAITAGDLTVRTLSGGADITITLAAGDWIGPRSDMPCFLRAVRQTAAAFDVYKVAP